MCNSSSCEAEYVAIAHGAKAVLFSKSVTSFVKPYPPEDSFSTCRESSEVCEKQVLPQGAIVNHIASDHQTTGILTVSFGCERFVRHRAFLMDPSG